MDEKDWRSAKMMFEKILDIAPPYVIYEAAEAFIADKSPDYALDLYDRLDQTSMRALQGRVSAYMIIGSDKDITSSIQDYLDNEFSGTQQYSEIISMLLSSGHPEEAKRVLDRMARSNKKDPSYLISNAKVLLDMGDIRGAGKASREAVHYAKKDPSVRALAARIRFVSGDVKMAEKECDKILGEYPRNKDALSLKKDLLLSRGDTKGALEICKSLLEEDPGDIPTMLALSGAMNGEGDPNGALITLRNVLRQDPRAENSISVIEAMINDGFYRDAIFLCNDLERSLPPNAMIRRLKGNAEYCQHEYIKASATYAAAAELSPHDAVIWHSKGMADEARGDLESAEISYNRAVLLDIGRSEYWISKAVVQEALYDPYGVVESLNRAIELDPSSINPLIMKATILEKVGRFKDALHFIELCAVKEPWNEEVALARIRILRESGAIDEALQRARKIHEATHSEESILELASCLAVYGMRFDAIRVIEAGLDVTPDSERLRMALDSLEVGSEDLVSDSIVHEDIVFPEEDETKAMEEAESEFAIAESMRAMGDYRGAIRSVDHAMAVGGEKSKYICLKAEILLDMGNNKEAHDLLTDAIRKEPKNALYHEAMGDVRMGRSEYRGALQEYETAIGLGLTIPELYIKKGDAQQGIGYSDKSIESYTAAVSKDPDNSAYRYMLANKLYEREYLSRAETELEELLSRSPTDAEAMILLARVRRDARKDAGITEVYRMFKALDVDDPSQRERMIEILISAGHEDEANSLNRSVPSDAAVDVKVKRSTEKVLRRAYVSRASPVDEDLLLASGFEGEEAEAIREYIEKPVAFGEIVPGSPEFQKLERLSNEIIIKMGWKDLEDNQDLPLEKVFVVGSFKDVDEAKRFCAYVKKAMRVEVPRDDTLKTVLERVQGTTVYDIMKVCRVGIYQARQIKLILGISSPSSQIS